MQDGTYQNRVARAKELLGIVRHVAIATVNADGSPHNTPVFSTFGRDLTLYWASGAQAQHSQNITRDSRVFIVLFDSLERGGGLYVQANAEVLEDVADIEPALAIINANRARWNRPPVTADDYTGDQRLYRAIFQKAWVNVTERDQEGQVTSETRREVTPHDLLQ
jgi:hypothetical protein